MVVVPAVPICNHRIQWYLENSGSQVILVSFRPRPTFGRNMSQSNSQIDVLAPTAPDQSAPKRNRWHKRNGNGTNRETKPPGADHSLGFPQSKRCQSETGSSQSEVIMFSTPIISPDGVGSVLPSIEEPHPVNFVGSDGPHFHETEHDPRDVNDHDPTPGDSSHPISSVQYDDPWQDEEDVSVPILPNQGFPHIQPFNFRQSLFQSIIDGTDPWAEQP